MTTKNYANIEGTLNSAVATAGTFLVAYPSGYDRGDFEDGVDHRLVALQSVFRCPDDITLSFGGPSSGVTVTYNGATTLPAGTEFRLQLALPGQDIDDTDIGHSNAPKEPVKEVRKAELVYVNLGQPVASDDDLLRTNASISGAGALTLLTTSFDVPRNVIITSAGNDTGITFSVTGKDLYGNSMEETITGANATIAYGNKAFYSDIAVSASGASAGNVKIGSGARLGLPVYVGDYINIVGEVRNGLIRGGSPVAPVLLDFHINETDYLEGVTVGAMHIAPCDGVLESLTVTVNRLTAGASAITVKKNGSTVTGLGVTVANAAAVGTQYTDTPTSSTFVTKGDLLEVIADGVATEGSVITQLKLRPTGTREGDLIYGLGRGTKPTATNADVRGTYEPVEAPNSSNYYGLWVMTMHPSFIGNPQYTS